MAPHPQKNWMSSLILEFLLHDYPLVMSNIAIENGPFIDGLPIKTSIYTGFSMAMLNNQRVKLTMAHL